MLKIKLLRYLKRNPQQKLLIASLIGLTSYLLINRINNLFGGPNIYEKEALEVFNNFNPISGSQINILYFGVAKVLSILTSDLGALRLSSTIFGVISVINVRFILKHWIDSRVANLAVVVVASSFWFLVMARSGHPIIMPTFWLSSILAIYIWGQFTTKQSLSKIILAITLAISIYTPLQIWSLLILSIIFISLNQPKKTFKNFNFKLFTIWLLFILPLIYSAITAKTTLSGLTGINSLPTINPIQFAGNLFTNLGHLVFRGPLDPAINLSNLPLLDFFQTAFLILGVATVVKSKDRIKFGVLLIYPLAVIAVLSINKQLMPALVLVMPVIFINIMIGLIEFMGMWLRAFPKNPVGRLVGMIVCSALIAVSSYYNVHKYFTVWPNNPISIEAHKVK